MALSSGMAALIGGIIAAAGSITSSAISSHQAEKSDKRAMEYQQQLDAEQAAAEEKEAMLNQQSLDRSRAYGLSLLDGDTALENSLTGFGNDKEGSLLASSGSSVGNSNLSGSLFV